MNHFIDRIQIIPIKETNGLVAFASLVLDESLYLGSIAIKSSRSGIYRLIYPTRKQGDQSFPIYHPINKEMGDHLSEAVLEKFHAVYSVNSSEISYTDTSY